MIVVLCSGAGQGLLRNLNIRSFDQLDGDKQDRGWAVTAVTDDPKQRPAVRGKHRPPPLFIVSGREKLDQDTANLSVSVGICGRKQENNCSTNSLKICNHKKMHVSNL